MTTAAYGSSRTAALLRPLRTKSWSALAARRATLATFAATRLKQKNTRPRVSRWTRATSRTSRGALTAGQDWAGDSRRQRSVARADSVPADRSTVPPAAHVYRAVESCVATITLFRPLRRLRTSPSRSPLERCRQLRDATRIARVAHFQNFGSAVVAILTSQKRPLSRASRRFSLKRWPLRAATTSAYRSASSHLAISGVAYVGRTSRSARGCESAMHWKTSVVRVEAAMAFAHRFTASATSSARSPRRDRCRKQWVCLQWEAAARQIHSGPSS